MIALSGTPGTGKTSVGEELARRGRRIIELNDFIKEHGLLGRLDRKRGTREVDIQVLDEALAGERMSADVILVGHLAHSLSVDSIIVLRCRPSVLAGRLGSRGYPERKVKENVEAEALDVILVEAVETGTEVLEVDTTDMSIARAADAVEEILAGEREKYEVGHIDWSEEVLDWY
jgi:adenylate kinase